MTDRDRGTGQRIPINHMFGTDEIRRSSGNIGNRIYEGDLVKFFERELFDGTDNNYWGNIQPGTRFWIKQGPLSDTPEQGARRDHGWPLNILNHDYRSLKEASELDYVYNMIQPAQRLSTRTSRDDPRPAHWSSYQRAMARATKRDQVHLKVYPRPRGETRKVSAYPPILTTVVKTEVKSEIKSEPSDSPPTERRQAKRRHDDSQPYHTTNLRNVGKRITLRRSNAEQPTSGSATASSRGVKRAASAPIRRIQTRKVLNIALSAQFAKGAHATRITEVYIFTTVPTHLLMILAGILLALGVLALMVHNGGPNANESRLSHYRRQIVHYINNRILATRRLGASIATASPSSITSPQATSRSPATTPLLEAEALDINDPEDAEAAMLAMSELGNAIAGHIATSQSTDQHNAHLPDIPQIPREEQNQAERILELLFQDIAYTTEQYRVSRVRRDQAIQNGFQALRSSISGVSNHTEAIPTASLARGENDASHLRNAPSGLLVDKPPQEEQQRNVRPRTSIPNIENTHTENNSVQNTIINQDATGIGTCPRGCSPLTPAEREFLDSTLPTFKDPENPTRMEVMTPADQAHWETTQHQSSQQATTGASSNTMDRPPLAQFSTSQHMAHCSPPRGHRCALTRSENEAQVVENLLSSTSRSGEHFRNLSDDRWQTNIIRQGLHQPRSTSTPRNPQNNHVSDCLLYTSPSPRD